MATLRVSPKLTSSTGVSESITPSPAGLIGMAPSTLAIPYAANSPTGSVKWPNAAMKHHSDAASSSQLRDAQVSELTRTRRSVARPRSESLACSTIFSSFSPPTLGILSPMARTMRAARGPPRVKPTTRAAIAASRIAPTMATVPYSGRNPATGMEITRASHSSTFSTTVEPMPLVAIITPTSVPSSPSEVNSW